MAEVERTWFRRRFIGEQIEPIFFTEAVVALEAEIVITRNTAAAVNVDERGELLVEGQPVDLRWILVHMIEEYARHVGHMDLLRQAVDGRTGD
jgi:hypothetical protein